MKCRTAISSRPGKILATATHSVRQNATLCLQIPPGRSKYQTRISARSLVGLSIRRRAVQSVPYAALGLVRWESAPGRLRAQWASARDPRGRARNSRAFGHANGRIASLAIAAQDTCQRALVRLALEELRAASDFNVIRRLQVCLPPRLQFRR